ncbi:DUF732 domain-containing protein [Mycolicibacterium sp. 624]|uniref:DUF732 domain-containing protein n=1 Tax=Mycolicibacterium sp. 624 TaxID=3156314 RepID=UPI003398787F
MFPKAATNKDIMLQLGHGICKVAGNTGYSNDVLAATLAKQHNLKVDDASYVVSTAKMWLCPNL